MDQLHIYNSLSGKKEPFVPITPPYVGLYVCGPTVSGESHLGHARPYITFDVVNRYLQHLGYKVRYVRNITDAGHFEEEGREAEDKISTKALLEKLEPMELVQKYTNLFHWAMAQFGNLPPSIEPTATGHIVEQIEMIKKIMADGYAYEVNGSVYFDVVKYHSDFSQKGLPYGILSGRVLEDMLETTRDLDGQDEKRTKADFALWKKAPPTHIMRWASPWGEGFPGWHIECSAMSKKYLGDSFDIHGGGMDLQFPHHECEIAQSAVASGGKLNARFWMHNNMITINGRKMGKSYNNVIKLTELFSGDHPLLTQAYAPSVIRFLILQTHYRSTLDFSNEGLQAAEKGLKRLMEALQLLPDLYKQAHAVETSADAGLEEKVLRLVGELDGFMNDDFNTAKVLANLFELAPVLHGLKDGHIAQNALSQHTLKQVMQKTDLYTKELFALQWNPAGAGSEKLMDAIQLLVDLRTKAKVAKDYATSDLIRIRLTEMGVVLKDDKTGHTRFSFA